MSPDDFDPYEDMDGYWKSLEVWESDLVPGEVIWPDDPEDFYVHVEPEEYE